VIQRSQCIWNESVLEEVEGAWQSVRVNETCTTTITITITTTTTVSSRLGAAGAVVATA